MNGREVSLHLIQEKGSAFDADWSVDDALFAFEAFDTLVPEKDSGILTVQDALPGFLLIAKGEGELLARGERYRLRGGCAYLREAGERTRVRASSDGAVQLRIKHVLFRPVLLPGAERMELAPNRAEKRDPAKPFVEAAAPLLELADGLTAGDADRLGMPGMPGLRLERHMMIQQMLLWWMRHMAAEETERDRLDSVIDYMHRHYHLLLTMSQLASLAGYSVSHFALLFKRRTGCSPTDYLDRLRMNRAKELLQAGKTELKMIAPRTGCKDEWYFSRKFKKRTGLSPTQYRKRPREHIVSYSMPISNHLLALRVRPSAAVVHPFDHHLYRDGTVCLHHERMETWHVDKLKDWQPDLTLFLNELTPAEQAFRERARAWTPTVTIPWMEMDWQEQMLTIAAQVGRRDDAAAWIADYETQARETRKTLRASVGAEESAAIFVIAGNRCSVYGLRNIGYVLYRSLKLAPPPALRRQFETEPNFYALEVSAEQIPEYAADRTMVMVRRDIPGTASFFGRLRRTPHWRALEQKSRVCFVDADPWLKYDPLSIVRQLSAAAQLLSSGLSK